MDFTEQIYWVLLNSLLQFTWWDFSNSIVVTYSLLARLKIKWFVWNACNVLCQRNFMSRLEKYQIWNVFNLFELKQVLLVFNANYLIKWYKHVKKISYLSFIENMFIYLFKSTKESIKMNNCSNNQNIKYIFTVITVCNIKHTLKLRWKNK